ncbi:MAG: hypothetical protein ACTSVL_02770 [Promethearchaeota archaeon]
MSEIQNEMLQLGVYALVVRGEGQDLLMGKNVRDYVEINGLEKLLHFFIADLDKVFSFIYDNDIASYLNALEEKFNLDLSSLQVNIEQNIEAMVATDSDDIMIYYLVITKTLENIRQQVFDINGWSWIEKSLKKKNKTLTKEIKNDLNSLDEEGNQDLSLLYNLVFTNYLAKIYKDTDMLKKSQKLIEDSIENLIQNLE